MNEATQAGENGASIVMVAEATWRSHETVALSQTRSSHAIFGSIFLLPHHSSRIFNFLSCRWVRARGAEVGSSLLDDRSAECRMREAFPVVFDFRAGPCVNSCPRLSYTSAFPLSPQIAVHMPSYRLDCLRMKDWSIPRGRLLVKFVDLRLFSADLDSKMVLSGSFSSAALLQIILNSVLYLVY